MNNHLNTPPFSSPAERASQPRIERSGQQAPFSEGLQALRQNTGAHFSKAENREQQVKTAIQELRSTPDSAENFAQAVHLTPEFFMSSLQNTGKSVNGAASLEAKLSQVQA
jgi:superoxide dismutase